MRRQPLAIARGQERRGRGSGHTSQPRLLADDATGEPEAAVASDRLSAPSVTSSADSCGRGHCSAPSRMSGIRNTATTLAGFTPAVR